MGVGVALGFLAKAGLESARPAQSTAKVFMYPIRTFAANRMYVLTNSLAHDPLHLHADPQKPR